MRCVDIKIGDPVSYKGIPCVIRCLSQDKAEIIQSPWFGDESIYNGKLLETRASLRLSLLEPINLLNWVKCDNRFIPAEITIEKKKYKCFSWKSSDFAMNILPSPKYIDTAYVVIWNKHLYDDRLDSYICANCTYLHEFFHCVQQAKIYARFNTVSDVDKYNYYSNTGINYIKEFSKLK